MSILISVIVPIYKVEKYIERCLNSLFNQTIANSCEFILVNDATPDLSFEIAKNVVSNYPLLNQRIVLIDKKQNQGLAAARISGIQIARGSYVINIDSDDWCEHDMLEQLYAKAKEHNSDIVNCDLIFEYKNRSVISKQNPFVMKNFPLKNLLLGQYGAFMPIKLIKRNLFENVILTNNRINMWEDLFFSVPIYLNANIVSYLEKPLYHYERSNENSLCNNITESNVENLFFVVDLLIDYLKEKCYFNMEEIQMLKCRTKCFLFPQMDILLINRYKDKYKEVNGQILKSKCISFHKRVITYLLCNNFSILGVLLIKVQNLLKKVIK